MSPVIDTISDETFAYMEASMNIWGGFNWRLSFRWYHVPTAYQARRFPDQTQPVRSGQASPVHVHLFQNPSVLIDHDNDSQPDFCCINTITCSTHS